MVELYLKKKLPSCFPRMAVPFYIPTSIVGETQFLCILVGFSVVPFFPTILDKNCIKCLTLWFDIHSEVITTVNLINIPSHIVIFFVMRAPEIYSHSKLPVFDTVLLTIATTLYIRSLYLFILYNCNFVPFDQHFPIVSISPALVATLLLSDSMHSTFWDSTYKWDHAGFFFFLSVFGWQLLSLPYKMGKVLLTVYFYRL